MSAQQLREFVIVAIWTEWGQRKESMWVSVCGLPGVGSVPPNLAVPDPGASIPFVSSDPEKVNSDVSFKPAFHALPTR